MIVYNLPGVPRGLRMNADVVSSIYLGEITMWNDRRIVNLNPKVRLPNMPITVVHRSDGSGTSFIYTNSCLPSTIVGRQKWVLGNP